MISHHPPPELLLDYAAGALPEALALVIATHATMCANCGSIANRMQALGGLLLEDSEPAAVDDDLLAGALARLDEPAAPMPAPEGDADAETLALVPRPLRRYLGRSLDGLPWRPVGGMFKEFRLPMAGRSLKASLMRLRPGARMPQHTHRGNEYSVVLAGGYQDAGEAFGRGDFAANDASRTHQPVVDADRECLCLVVLDAPLKLTSTFGRLFNPFLRL